jgi:hypothetical protein
VLGALAAAVASGALIFWISQGQDRTFSAPGAGSTPAASQLAGPAGFAPVRADAGQVVRAYEQLQETYADQGARGVMSFGRACADQLKTDPGVLDFCLAFDIYAAALAEDDAEARAWQAEAGARDLALARQTLPPGVDPGQRLAKVRELARQASLEAPETKVAAPAPAPAQRAVTARRAHAAAPCQAVASAARSTVCASPALREADRRMRLAYRHAVAAGADPRKLAREQTRWRSSLGAAPSRPALARLYHRRTRQQQLLARRPEPPKRSTIARAPHRSSASTSTTTKPHHSAWPYE